MVLLNLCVFGGKGRSKITGCKAFLLALLAGVAVLTRGVADADGFGVAERADEHLLKLIRGEIAFGYIIGIAGKVSRQAINAEGQL